MTDKEKIIRILCDALDGCPLLYPCDKLFSPDGWCREHCKSQEPDAECWLKYAKVMAEEAKNSNEEVKNSNENALDAISRQAAIDEMKALYEWHDTVTEDRTIDHLKRLPSAQLEPQWIPVSERLPERGKEVLVTRDYDGREDHNKSCRYVETASCYGEEDDISWYSYSDEYKMTPGAHRVIAWKPLPIPYRPPKN